MHSKQYNVRVMLYPQFNTFKTIQKVTTDVQVEQGQGSLSSTSDILLHCITDIQMIRSLCSVVLSIVQFNDTMLLPQRISRAN